MIRSTSYKFNYLIYSIKAKGTMRQVIILRTTKILSIEFASAKRSVCIWGMVVEINEYGERYAFTLPYYFHNCMI